MTKFVLINADTGEPVPEFDPLAHDAFLDLAVIGTTNLNVQAVTSPATAGSVVFALNTDTNYRTDSQAPYALAGDDGGVFGAWSPENGVHRLAATAFEGPDASGPAGDPLAIRFTVSGAGLPLNSVPEGEVYREQNGIIVMEAENASLADGWTIRPATPTPDVTMAGAKGSGWLEWGGAQYTGNTIGESAAISVITYTFRIETPGVYHFRWRSKQYTDVASFDAGNDTFVRFATGSTPQGAYDFGSFTKVWVQSRESWSWRTTGEPHHGEHYHNGMSRRYVAGVHQIQFAARSPGHAIDRIVLHHDGVSFNEQSFNEMSESQRGVESNSGGDFELINISTRGVVGTGGDVMIAGFVIEGTSRKTVLIQGAGPELGAEPINIGGALVDPVLTLRSGDSILASNDDWEDDNAMAKRAAASQVGAFALADASKSSRILIELDPGIYTATLAGADGATGVAIIEVYSVEPTP